MTDTKPWNAPTIVAPTAGTPGSDPWLTQFTIGDEQGKQTVMGPDGETYIVWDGKQYVPVPGIDAARNMVLTAAGTSVKKLKEALLKGRFISQDQFNRDDYNEGLNEALRTYSVSVLQDYQIRAPKDPNAKFGQNFSSYLGTMQSGSGSTPVTDQTYTTKSLSTRVQNNRRLEKYLVALTGQVPTAQDYKDFDEAVFTAESLAKTKVTTETDKNGSQVDTKQTILGGQLAEDEYLVMAAKIGRYTLRGISTDPEKLKKLMTGGASIAQDISALKKHANDQGISLNDADALDYVISGLGKPSNENDRLSVQKERINQSAITFYSNNKALADHISKGGTYKDISDIYAGYKTKKLGIVIPNSTVDEDIRRAISMGMSGSDFDREMQAKPAWMETPEAHEVAGSYLDTILTKFGFAG